jgi:hypothetical protein
MIIHAHLGSQRNFSRLLISTRAMIINMSWSKMSGNIKGNNLINVSQGVTICSIIHSFRVVRTVGGFIQPLCKSAGQNANDSISYPWLLQMRWHIFQNGSG